MRSPNYVEVRLSNGVKRHSATLSATEVQQWNATNVERESRNIIELNTKKHKKQKYEKARNKQIKHHHVERRVNGA